MDEGKYYTWDKYMMTHVCGICYNFRMEFGITHNGVSIGGT